MTKNEKNSREDITQLEKKLKELTDQNSKFLKEKKNLELSNDFINKEIDSKKEQIVKYMKILSRTTETKNEKVKNTKVKKANLYVMEEQIIKLFNTIQKNTTANLQEKFRSNTEYLYGLQKEMKVSYIIIKKLDIKEDFLRSNKLAESTK